MRKIITIILIFCFILCGCKKQDDTTKDTIIVYFSATGTTESLAKKLQEQLSCDINELVPEITYTKEDLDYINSESRSSIEKINDLEVEYHSDIQDYSSYKNMIIAYPIWYGTLPQIIKTFLTQQDFEDITLIPVCTSSSSDINESVLDIREIVDCDLVEGTSFTKEINDDDIDEFIKNMATKPLISKQNSTDQEEVNKVMKLYINEQEIPVTWNTNKAAEAIKKDLKEDDIVIKMHHNPMYNEQVGSFNKSYPTNNQSITSKCGDLILYSSSQLVAFYGPNSWSYTYLGHIDLDDQEIKELLSHEDVVITLTLK